MDAESWNDLGALIVNVLALPPEERIDFLDEECGADTALRAEVELRLADYDKAPSYFDSLGEGLIPRVDDLEELPAGDFTPDPYLLIGRDVAHYRVTEHLGGGGMGVVYKAEDTRLHRTVALKFLPPFLKDDAQARRRFLQEARAASALDHPNICTVYEIKETEEGRLFIAMAYYEGETLKKKISRGPLPLDTALDLTLQTARGLAHAHARGIVHRDVKPANVMVTQEGLVKVLDFGLAKLAGSAQITRTGTTLGTVAYMPPEQARGEVVDHRADIWSLGAVFYELVAGQRAFPGDYHQAVFYAVLNQDPQPITGLRAGLPMHLGLIINKMLAKSVEDRCQRMTDLLADLEAVQQRQVARSMVAQAVLPAPKAPAAAPAPRPPTPDEDEPLTLLVVDDEPELELLIQQKFKRAIRTGEWRLLFASDGREALKEVQDHPEIALILTDINMPKMDGLTLLSRLAEIDRPIKTIVVSAYGDMNNIRTAMNRGAFDFVTKPIDFKDLEATIRKTHKELLALHKATEARHQLHALQKEFEVARRIQEAILPLTFPDREDVDLYAFITTAREVGGTFYDFFSIGEHQVGFLIGDVAGKGVPAALFMAMSQTFLKGIAVQGEAPGTCLTTMNRLLFPEGFPELYVTVFYGLLDTQTGALAYSNAGHRAPYVLRADGSVAPLDEDENPPIWQTRSDEFPTRKATLKPGEGLFLFTKGVTEAVDERGHAFSTDRLAAQLRDVQDEAPARMIRAVVRAVMQHADELQDDVTVLALRYRGR